jgi:hypothetical protein
MLKTTVMAAVVAIAAGAAFITPSEAAPTYGKGPTVHRPLVHHVVYPRFRHRHGRYVYFYHGYWYAKPWWRHHTV